MGEGSARELEGVPFAVKDLFDSEGVRHADRLDARRARPDARRRRWCRWRAREAGAILVGKTQTHEFAWGITSVNELLGSAHNPWALDRVSGGSSGGSAVAIAAGEVPFALAATPAARSASPPHSAGSLG